MDVFREYMWLWVICGIVFGSVLITILFFLINKWISRSEGKHRVSKLQRGFLSNVESNNYQERGLNSLTPPLPPRTQFLIEECQSYENLAEQPDDGDNGDYEEATTEFEHAPDAQLDYVKVENEVDLLPPPPPAPYLEPDTDDDGASTEDYDDIGGEDENQDEEDYDDVG